MPSASTDSIAGSIDSASPIHRQSKRGDKGMGLAIIQGPPAITSGCLSSRSAEYKGIPLAVSVATVSNAKLKYSCNRKEEKDHGDKGKLLGSPLKDQKVVIIDDVITSGSSVVEAADVIKANEGILKGVVVFIDRMERPGVGFNGTSKEYLEDKLKVPVYPVITIQEIVQDSYASKVYSDECAAISEFLNQ